MISKFNEIEELFKELDKKGLIIPIMNKLNELRENFFDGYEKQNS
ncbi:MAG: hypothetical protein U9R34_03395 [Nanoarchaeota archaeon]|nr:hypothetical protein [Nanoarchaeota archaeon]